MRLCTRNQTLQRCSASTYPTSDPCRTERWRRELNRGRPWSQLILFVGAIGIANVTLVSVLERVGEIGLRRAVGATRRHIAAQFLAESAAMGLIGASIGVLIIVAVSATRQWTPVLDPWVPLAAPLVGAATGLIAGLYPSWRSVSLESIDALRTGM